jgi:hypothetical protein
MIADLSIKTVLGAERAYACIEHGYIRLDVPLAGGRSAANALRQWAGVQLEQAAKQQGRALIAIAAANSLEKEGSAAMKAQASAVSVIDPVELLERLAGFASHFAPEAALRAGGAELVAQAIGLAALCRGQQTCTSGPQEEGAG